MTKQAEALKLAIKAMKSFQSRTNGLYEGEFQEEINAIKEALTQPEQDKERCVGCEACIDTACGRDECPKGWPKAPQRTWVGLTDDEIDEIEKETWDEDHKSWGIHDFAEAIEAKLKEKNT